eukprot:COSAG02_NODE_348_length_24081_cov_19.231007_12_plen_65_part_00
MTPIVDFERPAGSRTTTPFGSTAIVCGQGLVAATRWGLAVAARTPEHTARAPASLSHWPRFVLL